MTGRGKGGKGLGGYCKTFVPPEDELKRARKDREYESSKRRKMTIVTTIEPHKSEVFSDIFIQTHLCAPTKGVNKRLTSLLSGQLVTHRCNYKCFQFVPRLVFENAFDFISCLQPSENGNYKLPFIHRTCDERCSEETRDYALNIIDEFISEQDSFQSHDLIVLPSPRKNSHRSGVGVEINFFEFKSCGKLCYFVTDYYMSEACFLLLNDVEYVFGGHYGGHPFFGLPTVRYENSDGSSPEILPIDEEDAITAITLPNILTHFREFMHGLIADQYH